MPDRPAPELARTLAEATLHRQGYQIPQRTLFDLLPPDKDPGAAHTLVLANPPYTGKHRERVIQFFLDRGNAPASNQEIREAVGMTRGAVAVILYEANSEFEKVGKDQGNKMRWRLTTDAFERLLTKRVKDKQPPDETGG